MGKGEGGEDDLSSDGRIVDGRVSGASSLVFWPMADPNSLAMERSSHLSVIGDISNFLRFE